MAPPITRAASVLLVRDPQLCELFVVRRADTLRFFGGFVAFPGGKVCSTDADIPVESGAVDSDPVCGVAAVRELFEETGVLLARRPDGSFPLSNPELARLRQDLIAGQAHFSDILNGFSLSIRDSDLALLGRLTTPAFAAVRFDTAFFLCFLPPGQQAEVWPGELQEGRWIAPGALLEEWERGDCLVSPPTVQILMALRHQTAITGQDRLRSLFRHLDEGAIHPIFFAPGVQMIPLRSQVLPPSTHTNAYLVGQGPRYLLDPGPTDAEEQQRLFAVLEAHQHAGRRLTAVVLTHHHPDHIGAATACTQRFDVPIWAHPLTARKLQGKVAVTRELHEGDRLDLGPAPDGGGPWFLEALHTPGHAVGHLAFYDPRYRLLFAGDMVSTQSSVVIAPPEGDLVEYLAALRRLRTYPIRLLLPAHGSPTARPEQLIDEALAHRRKREDMLLAALEGAPRTVADLALELYRGVAEEMLRFANYQVLAGLQKLQREGRVEALGTDPEVRWRLLPIQQ